MKFSTLAWAFAGSMVIAGGGIGAVACSSSTGGTGNPTNNPDTGTGGDTGGNPDTGVGNDTGTNPDTGPLPDGGPGIDCGSGAQLRPGTAGKLYCPFGEGGAPINCPTQTHCCIGGKVNGVYQDSVCEATGTTCPNGIDAGGTDVECEDPATDCASGQLCCGTPNSINPVPGCGYSKLTGWKYTHCVTAAACSNTEFQVCEQPTGQCPTGQTCTPFKAKGVQMGFCM